MGGGRRFPVRREKGQTGVGDDIVSEGGIVGGEESFKKEADISSGGEDSKFEEAGLPYFCLSCFYPICFHTQ